MNDTPGRLDRVALIHEHDAGRNGRWVLRRFDGEPTGPDRTDPDWTPGDWLGGNHQIGPDAVSAAQTWATREMYRHAVHTVGWEPQTNGEWGFYRAITAPRGGWEVTAYLDRNGLPWQANPDGTLTGPGGTQVSSRAALETVVGPLTPMSVTSIAALVAEVRIFRAVAEYHHGQRECHARECDHMVGDDGNEIPGLDACPLLDVRIATADDAVGMERVRDALTTLDKVVALSGEDLDDHFENVDANPTGPRGGIEYAVATIREAVEREEVY